MSDDKPETPSAPYEVSARERKALENHLLREWWDRLGPNDDVVGDDLIDALVEAGWAPKVEFGAYMMRTGRQYDRNKETLNYQRFLLARAERQLTELRDKLNIDAEVRRILDGLTDADGSVYRRVYDEERKDQTND